MAQYFIVCGSNIRTTNGGIVAFMDLQNYGVWWTFFKSLSSLNICESTLKLNTLILKTYCFPEPNIAQGTSVSLAQKCK